MGISPDRILYRDDHLLIVNKRAGELVVAAEGQGKLPLYDWLHKSEPGLRVVHRLDFGTSGVLVFARTADAIAAIRASKFAGWKKTYITIVHGVPTPPSGRITKDLPARTHEGLVPAVTNYNVVRAMGKAALVELVIETGRKHQIRRHMQGIGHPLVLDAQYGDAKKDRWFKQKTKFRRMFLHAAALSFPHPITKKTLSVRAPVPKTFQECLERLRGL